MAKTDWTDKVIDMDDLILYLKERIQRRGVWGKLTIQFREGSPLGVIVLEETRIVPKRGEAKSE